MLEKQKVKDGNRNITDTEKIQQIIVEKGYYKEEELGAIEINFQNVIQDNLEVKLNTPVIIFAIDNNSLIIFILFLEYQNI